LNLIKFLFSLNRTVLLKTRIDNTINQPTNLFKAKQKFNRFYANIHVESEPSAPIKTFVQAGKLVHGLKVQH